MFRASWPVFRLAGCPVSPPMNLSIVQRILGMLLMLFSLTMLPPLGVSLYYQDGNWQPFVDALVALLLLGGVIWFPVRTCNRELRLRDGFLVGAAFWVVLGVAGAVPFLLSDKPVMSVTNAVFESVSGFTTTGATVLEGLERLPRSVLYYRQQIQWLGGIGMIVLAVALLPMLGVGGMQLLRAETPGAVKDSKLTPRITQTAKMLWMVYVAITAMCALAYWFAGMSPFDAIGHSFTTVSTGGFSTHDASLGYFNSTAIEMIAVVFMFLGGVNFALHFYVFRYRRISGYVTDPEFRAYAVLILVLTLITTLALATTNYHGSFAESFNRSLFHVVSVQSNTGFITDQFALWPGALPVMLLLMSFISGCAGSTSGGMKVFRWLLIWKQGSREVRRLIHPSAEIPVKLGGKPMDPRVIEAVWGFFAVYVVLFGVLMVSLIALGEDQVTAFAAIASCMNNLGPGLGDVAMTFANVSDPVKWICVLAMLAGRLEIFPLLVLITPAFWRR
jgi:trk system potassium uptake protein TrkH